MIGAFIRQAAEDAEGDSALGRDDVARPGAERVAGGGRGPEEGRREVERAQRKRRRPTQGLQEEASERREADRQA